MSTVQIVFTAVTIMACLVQSPTQMKYDLLEGFTVGANKYCCGCGYKLVSYGNVVGAYSTTAPSG